MEWVGCAYYTSDKMPGSAEKPPFFSKQVKSGKAKNTKSKKKTFISLGFKIFYVILYNNLPINVIIIVVSII